MAPLAGPVVAGAVILPRNYKLRGLNDSKKILDQETREELAVQIKHDAVCWAFGFAEVEEIDQDQHLSCRPAGDADAQLRFDVVFPILSWSMRGRSHIAPRRSAASFVAMPCPPHCCGFNHRQDYARRPHAGDGRPIHWVMASRLTKVIQRLSIAARSKNLARANSPASFGGCERYWVWIRCKPSCSKRSLEEVDSQHAAASQLNNFMPSRQLMNHIKS